MESKEGQDILRYQSRACLWSLVVCCFTVFGFRKIKGKKCKLEWYISGGRENSIQLSKVVSVWSIGCQAGVTKLSG